MQVDPFLIFKEPPFAAILIMLASMSVTTISNLATRKLSDVRRLRRYQTEIKQHQEMTKKAQETGNKKLLRKVKRRKAYIDRIQREMMTQRCKPTLIFFVPFVIILTLLRDFFTAGGQERIVAILPFNPQKVPFLAFLEPLIGVSTAAGFGLYYLPFYMMVGLGLGQILQRLMGVNIMATT
jgi:uncharacterized membrane protein (DUF106 family)